MSDVERKLLSKMTSVEDIKAVYDHGVREELFEDPFHRLMFVFMMDYWKKSSQQDAPTWLVMETEYPSVPLETNVEETTTWCCEWLKKRYTVNQTQDIIRRAATKLGEEQNKADGDPAVALKSMWQEAYAAAQITTPRSVRSDMSENVQERRERYNLDRDDPDLLGVSFGLAELDEHTRGLRPGELAAVAAYTKVGKSWLLANAYVSNHKVGKRPIMFTLEMDIAEMEDRIDCLYSGVSYSKFTRRELSMDEMLDLERGRAEMVAAGRAIMARPERGDRTVRTMMTEARQHGADFVMVDQLSWIDSEQRYTGDSAMRMKHGELIVDLKEDGASASAGKLPMFIAVQQNRRSQQDPSGNGRGALDNFANSSMIEQSVDIALGLWRNTDMRNSNLMGMDIMGTRRCDKKSWLLNWHLNARTEIRIAEEYEEPN